MNYPVTETGTWESQRRVEHATNRAFLAAHLLTASAQQAENAVMEAIDSWDPDDASEEALYQQVLHIALRREGEHLPPLPGERDADAGFLPSELRAVTRLSPRLRRCYVLRILAGLSRQACARMLHLDCRRVDLYTNAALKSMPFLAARPNAGVEYMVWDKKLA